MGTEQTGTGNVTTEKKLRAKRKSGEYRYQKMVKADDGAAAWMDSEDTYKGHAEALAAGGNEAPGTVIRAIRVASQSFEIEAVTTTALKKIKA